MTTPYRAPQLGERRGATHCGGLRKASTYQYEVEPVADFTPVQTCCISTLEQIELLCGRQRRTEMLGGRLHRRGVEAEPFSGDAIIASIAAASIVAKVTRDRLMTRLGLLYPGYGFENHKGYSVPEHFAALARLGPTIHHRRSFAPVAAAYGDPVEGAVAVDELAASVLPL